MKIHVTAMALSLALPAMLSAEEIGGMTASFDGEEREWHIISVTRGERTAMSASFSGPERLPTLSLQGHPEPRFTTSDVLAVSGSWFNGYDPGKSITGVEINFMPQGMSKPFYTSHQVPGEATMTLESLELGEETGQAAGAFSGKICLVQELYGEPDLADCKEVSGRFDTLLQVR
ncbi:hypothetical protein ACW9UR_23370 [Halovulum sp. GXIMD14794]